MGRTANWHLPIQTLLVSSTRECHCHGKRAPVGVSKGGVAPFGGGLGGTPSKNTLRAGGWERAFTFFILGVPVATDMDDSEESLRTGSRGMKPALSLSRSVKRLDPSRDYIYGKIWL